MKDLGLRITYRDGSAPAVTHSTSAAPSLPSPAAVPGGTSHVLSDPLLRPASSFSMSSSTLRGNSPIKPDLKVPLRPDTAFFDQGHNIRMPYSNPHITNPLSSPPAVSKDVPFSPRSRVESFNEPTSQSLYVSQIEREVCAQSTPDSADANKTYKI